MSITSCAAAPHICRCNASNLDEFMKIHRTLSKSLLPTKLFDLRVPEVLLGCRDSTKIPLGWPVSLISKQSVPHSYPSFPSPRLPRARTLAYFEKLHCCLGRGRQQGSLIESKQTFVDRDGVYPPRNQATWGVIGGQPFREPQLK